MKKRWPTRITSHSIYAVVGMPHTTGALAQRYNFWAKAPEGSTHLQHGINAVPSYFYKHGFPPMSFTHCGHRLFCGGSKLGVTRTLGDIGGQFAEKQTAGLFSFKPVFHFQIFDMFEIF